MQSCNVWTMWAEVFWSPCKADRAFCFKDSTFTEVFSFSKKIFTFLMKGASRKSQDHTAIRADISSVLLLLGLWDYDLGLHNWPFSNPEVDWSIVVWRQIKPLNRSHWMLGRIFTKLHILTFKSQNTFLSIFPGLFIIKSCIVEPWRAFGTQWNKQQILFFLARPAGIYSIVHH